MRTGSRVLTVVAAFGACWLVVANLPLGAQSSSSGPTFDGLIEASRVIDLTAPVDGLLEKVHVQRGDAVTSGQIVATLESSVETATWELAQAKANMEAEERSRKARVVFLGKKLKRDEKLHEQGMLSDDELDLTRTEFAVAEEMALESKERRKLAKLEEKRAAALLALRTVRSPIDGVVTDRHLDSGELVTRQHQSKILQLAQIDPLVVNVIVPADHFGRVKVGEACTVLPTGFDHDQSRAVVKTVDRVIDARSDTFRVSLELPNPEQKIPAGIRCTVTFAGRR